MQLSDEDLADIVHGAHARLNARTGDPYSDEPWETLPDEHRQMVIERVRLIRQGYSPAVVHSTWVAYMANRGWSLGPVKDLEKKEHPSLISYGELPILARRKILLAFRIVYALTMEH